MKKLILSAVFFPCVLFASAKDFEVMITILIFMIPFHLSLSLIAGFSINLMFKYGRKIYLLVSLFICVVTLLLSGIFVYYDVLAFEDKIISSYITSFVLSVVAAYLLLSRYKKNISRNKGKN
ncbi:MAG: hypothetical protein KA015_00305 [Spirochaetes bacterium]|nr:hypothetical protein [Spirochaetota bacterium]